MTERTRRARLAPALLALTLGLALGGCGVVHRGSAGAGSPDAGPTAAPAGASPTTAPPSASSPAAAPIRQDDLTGLAQSLSDAAALDDEVGTDMAADAGESSS